MFQTRKIQTCQKLYILSLKNIIHFQSPQASQSFEKNFTMWKTIFAMENPL